MPRTLRTLLVACCLAIVVTGSLSAADPTPNTPMVGDLRYDPFWGTVTLVPPEDGTILAFSIQNAAGGLRIIPNLARALPWEPDERLTVNRPFDIGSADIELIGTTEPFTLGPILPTDMDARGLREFLDVAAYSPGLGIPPVDFDLVVIPEPQVSGWLLLISLLAGSRRPWRRGRVNV